MITVSSGAMLQALKKVERVKANKMLPITEYLLVSSEDGKLIVTATDLECKVSASFPCEKSFEPFLLNKEMGLKVFSSIPEQPVSISLENDGNAVILKTDKGRFQLGTESPNDYPANQNFISENSFSISSNKLIELIKNTIFAVSNDLDRAALNCLNFEVLSKEIVCSGTDARQLSMYKIDFESENNYSFLLPKKAAELVLSVIKENESVTVEVSDSWAKFSNQNDSVICRLRDERYPNVRQVIPHNDKEATFNTKELIQSLDRVSLFSDAVTRTIAFRFNDVLSIESLANAEKEAKEKVNCDFSFDKFEIGANALILSNMLKQVQSSTVKFLFSAPNRVMLLQTDNENHTLLLMPVMI